MGLKLQVLCTANSALQPWLGDAQTPYGSSSSYINARGILLFQAHLTNDTRSRTDRKGTTVCCTPTSREQTQNDLFRHLEDKDCGYLAAHVPGRPHQPMEPLNPKP